MEEERKAQSLAYLHETLDHGGTRDKIGCMKRLLAQTASGTDRSDFFADVVKNVLTNTFELKKLVYIYLTYYANKNQELALLSINAFQKDMVNENQLIRALALRVMSSIRVGMVTQLVVLAIQKAVQDRSAYVRKTAALAVCKVYDLDADQKESLIEVISTLLRDKATMVIGAANTVVAFNRVCPDNYDIVHPHYRKLCHLLRDLDEWGQIAACEMFTRYARTQFLDPQPHKPAQPKPKREEEDEEEEEEEEEEVEETIILADDHRLLIRAVNPLLQSRNSAVVVSVAMLMVHAGPVSEMPGVARALVRILRSCPEVKFVALHCIVSLSMSRPALFEPYLKEFFVSGSDPVHCRGLKLQVLTHIAQPANISVILKEFQTYVRHHDSGFVAQTIRAIGQCAIRVPDVTDSCLQGLLVLMSSRVPQVVSESVVVVKKLLQVNPTGHDDAISKLARILDEISIPLARASIVWVIGEYFERMPRIAPDVLRKLAQTFAQEDDLVKLQTMNLASKLFVKKCEPFDKISLLFQYVLQLARYDQSYDVRDRARMLHALMLPEGGPAPSAGLAAELGVEAITEETTPNPLTVAAPDVLMAPKPVPSLESGSEERARYALGSLSHLVNHPVAGYVPLPAFPTAPTDAAVRQSADTQYEGISTPAVEPRRAARQRGASPDAFFDDGSSFYSSSSSSSYTGSSYSGSESGSNYTSDSESESESEEEAPPPRRRQQPRARPREASGLLDLAGFDPSTLGDSSMVDDLAGLQLDSVLSPGTAAAAAPLAAAAGGRSGGRVVVGGTARRVLLNQVTGGGLEVQYSFSRRAALFGDSMNHVRLHLANRGTEPIKDISVRGFSGVEAVPFQPILVLRPGEETGVDLNIDFMLKAGDVKFELVTELRSFAVKLAPPVGELMAPDNYTPEDFDTARAKLGGMNSKSKPITVPASSPLVAGHAVLTAVATACNLNLLDTLPLPGGGTQHRFVGHTLSADAHPILLAVAVEPKETGELYTVVVTVWSDHTIVSTRLCEAVRQVLTE